ncbi:hypothetical protein HSBAA_19660 [Vreelandella sulfidaeris]|uniref:Uncharacterized protein n=1 Tax=Vreelandella sulfidaeris TaxID=115553 RepID=A0A455U3K9_9GAMM|nr:hypothetical protein HSBAA_19660 [Halomonas sulfidaeris]
MRKERLIVPILAVIAVVWMAAQLLSSVLLNAACAKRWKIWKRGVNGVLTELRVGRAG